MDQKFDKFKKTLNRAYYHDEYRTKKLIRDLLRNINQDIKNEIKSSSLFHFRLRAPQVSQQNVDSLHKDHPFSVYIQTLSNKNEFKGKINRQKFNQIIQKNITKSTNEIESVLQRDTQHIKKLNKPPKTPRTATPRTVQQSIDLYHTAKTLASSPRVPEHTPGTRSSSYVMSDKQFAQRLRRLKSK